MSQPPEEIRFDSTPILGSYPIHRVEESTGSSGYSQQHKDRRYPPSKQDNQHDEPDPEDIVEVSTEYQTVASSPTTPPVPNPTAPKAADNPAVVPASTSDLHLDIKA